MHWHWLHRHFIGWFQDHKGFAEIWKRRLSADWINKCYVTEIVLYYTQLCLAIFILTSSNNKLKGIASG